MTADQLPSIEPSSGIGLPATWVYVGLILAAAALVAMCYIVDRHYRPTSTPTEPPSRTYRCQYGHGADRCPGNATRIVMLIAGPTESRVVCDEDAQRMVIRRQAIDLGPINRRTA